MTAVAVPKLAEYGYSPQQLVGRNELAHRAGTTDKRSVDLRWR
jgi:hypothetical protein